VSDEELGETYDGTRFIEQRHAMAQAWADYLDQLADRKTPPAHRFTPSPVVPPASRVAGNNQSAPVRALQ
jgi:hypothetical protein